MREPTIEDADSLVSAYIARLQIVYAFGMRRPTQAECMLDALLKRGIKIEEEPKCP